MQENIETHYDIHDMDNPKRWKKVPMTIHIQEDDSTAPSGKRRLSYDVAYTEDYELVGCLRRWANEVNNRFPNIKLWITGPMMEEITGNNEEGAEEVASKILSSIEDFASLQREIQAPQPKNIYTNFGNDIRIESEFNGGTNEDK